MSKLLPCNKCGGKPDGIARVLRPPWVTGKERHAYQAWCSKCARKTKMTNSVRTAAAAWNSEMAKPWVNES